MAPTAPSFPAIGFSSAEMNTREIYTRGVIASFLCLLALACPSLQTLGSESETFANIGFAHFEQRKTTVYFSTKYQMFGVAQLTKWPINQEAAIWSTLFANVAPLTGVTSHCWNAGRNVDTVCTLALANEAQTHYHTNIIPITNVGSCPGDRNGTPLHSRAVWFGDSTDISLLNLDLLHTCAFRRIFLGSPYCCMDFGCKMVQV